MTHERERDGCSTDAEDVLRCGAGPLARYRWLARNLVGWLRRRLQ